MSINTSSDGRLVHFPGKTVLSRQEAMHYLGVSRMAFLALRTLRCTPRPRLLDGRSVYREEELERFKTGLLQAVGVSQTDTPYQQTRHTPHLRGGGGGGGGGAGRGGVGGGGGGRGGGGG
ncbi:MAG: hypothetical protein ABF544_10405, partial [Acetobacter orientalis]|uniref:hypothetical protein n=1 Tax=Acetobacter orientalis TaxID=146474 RepID=UPI0039ECE143